MIWFFDPYARSVRLSRWRCDVLYRWYTLRHRLGIPKDDPSARYEPPSQTPKADPRG